MATPLDTLSLSQLLDLAIGMPQNGAVHFAAMRKLLQAVLGHLDVQYLTAQEPWTGELSGPSLAELAMGMKEMKQEMESCRKLVSETVSQEIGAMKAEHSRVSEDIRKIQEAQAMADSKHLQEIDKLKAAQSRMAEDMKKAQKERDQAMADCQDLREEIDRIKATLSFMEEDIMRIKETLASMKKMEDDIRKLREDIAKWKEEISKQITQQLESMLKETKSELKKMEEQQEMRNAMLEQMVTETTNQMQEKLGELEETVSTVQEEQEKAKCSKCTFDYKVLLGELVQRCEKLEEEVESLESRQTAVGKVENIIKQRSQDQQLLQHMEDMEDRVRKIQGDCEELSLVSENLQKDCEEKQKAIEMLFQSLETLKKNKAEEQNMLAAKDMKSALGSKVSCTQFEASMERIDQRMQEMQGQVLGQNEHWNEVEQQLSNIMENKLDRLELKPFHKQMEKTWQKSIKELEKKMAESDSAAGLRKQLPVPFTCLSCDRPVKTQVPGPKPETLPYLQPLPPIKDAQHSQRRTVVNGKIPRVIPSTGSPQSSRSLGQHIQASPRNNVRLKGITALPSKPNVTIVVGTSGPNSPDQKDQTPAVASTQEEPGPSTSQEQRPAKTRKPKHVSWAPQLTQIKIIPARETSPSPTRETGANNRYADIDIEEERRIAFEELVNLIKK
ncbi:glutamine-rich protein 2-like [Chiroxiphia lanceolata]|uniref:glutamine-rich protein 2-like n=1 Tax=Chiroxiphia lanceolata TaxID=296741 RepID=UPI0013CF2178|nr:glutamine-rich protein 2-like [Chiroxiphia lanceolata]